MAVVNLADRARAIARLRDERPQLLAGLIDVVVADVEELFRDAAFASALRAAIKGVAEAAGPERHGSWGRFAHDAASFRIGVNPHGNVYRIHLPRGDTEGLPVQLDSDARSAADLGYATQSGNMSPNKGRAAVVALLQASTVAEAYDFVATLNAKSAAQLAANTALFPGAAKLEFELAMEPPPSRGNTYVSDRPTGLILVLSFAAGSSAGPAASSLHDAALAGVAAHPAHLARLGAVGRQIGARLGMGLLEPAFLQQFLAAFDQHVNARAAGKSTLEQVPIGEGATLKVDIESYHQGDEGSFTINLPFPERARSADASSAFPALVDRTVLLDKIAEPGPMSPPWLASVADTLGYGRLYTAERESIERAVAAGVTAVAEPQYGRCLRVADGRVLQVVFSSRELNAALRNMGKS